MSVISLASHYRKQQHEHRVGGDTSKHLPLACSMLQVRYKTTGKAICVCIPAEPMTASQLNNCIVTLLADMLLAPRISIKIIWIPSGPCQFDVEVILCLLTTWVEDIHLYDEKLDPRSFYWEYNHGPSHPEA